MKELAILGTASNVGKSYISTGLCRLLANKGYHVAPFKSFNISLNACVTPDGLEISRSQFIQAEAARCTPLVYMNPILLKPSIKNQTQAIVNGKGLFNLKANDWMERSESLIEKVDRAYSTLKNNFDHVISEGSGAAVEPNYNDKLNNVGFVERNKVPFIVVGDIEWGGVFSQLVGTYYLLNDAQKNLLRGFIINRSRVDRSVLVGGIKKVEDITNVPVLGIVPRLEDVFIEEEDCMDLNNHSRGSINIGIVRFPYIANLTDVQPLLRDPQTSVYFIDSPANVHKSDLVILAGSKNVVSDLEFLKRGGLEDAIKNASKNGVGVMGICGGYQMIGKVIRDPDHVESDSDMIEGIGLVDAETIYGNDKETYCSNGKTYNGHDFTGYEIHYGQTNTSLPHFSVISSRNNNKASVQDGVALPDRLLWGTYIHGIFENDNVRNSIIDTVLNAKGKTRSAELVNYRDERQRSYDRLAQVIEKSCQGLVDLIS